MGLFHIDNDVPQLRRSRAVALDPSMTRRTTAPGNRRCSHPECTVVLSRYNPSTTCAQHGGWQDPESKGRRTRTA
jgi:hypothetical protein